MMEFEMFTWKLKRELRHNRKPLLLFFGNGYESQILLLALHTTKKKFKILHVASSHISRKVKNVFQKFGKYEKIILRPARADNEYKTFWVSNALCIENLNFGFSHKDYLIIAGFKLSEPSLMKAFQRGLFKNMYCPLLKYTDEQIETLYQDMVNSSPLGQFLYENLTSDSHHNITIEI